jgi:tight adherence protein C
MNDFSGAFADTLDTLAGCLEDGMTFDSAITRVSEDSQLALASEFERMLSEIQSGSKRRDAIRAMAQRVNHPDVTLFVNEVIQADEQGKRILDVVRSHAKRIRAE